MRRVTFQFVRLVLCIALLATSSLIVYGQFRAAVQGTVADNSGGVVPGATVILTSNETQRPQTVTTSDDGFYRFSNLAPGNYTLTVEQTNFKKQVVENITVEAETVQGLDVALEAGGISEIVTVSNDETAPLQTEDANIRNTISNAEVLRLPQVGRDPYELARLTPGVFGDGARGGGGGVVGLPNSTGPGGSNNSIFQTENQVQITANGQRTSANNFQIDGVSVNSQTFGGGAVITPSQEAVKEVTITSSSYSAEDGRNSGALVKVVSQNGTNDYHGSAFFKYNDPKFNAFNTFPGNRQRVENRLRQFGGSLGGPLPFFNFGEGGPFGISGKDKLFFYFAYEGLRTSSNNTYDAFVETPEYRNLVRTLRPGGTTAQVFSTPGLEPRIQSIIPATCSVAGLGPTRCQQVTGGLDIGSITGTRNVYLPLGDGLGRANIGGGLDGIPDIQFARLFNVNSFSGNQYFTRIDYNATDKDSIAVSTFFTPTLGSGSDTDGRSRPIGDLISDRLSYSVAVIYNRTISTTMFNQARFNYSGFSFNEVESNPNGNFGIPRIEIEGLPNRIRFGAPRGENTPGIFSEKSVDFNDTFNWVLGNHALKFGTQLRFDFNNNSIIGGARPFFIFVSLFTFANDTPILEEINASPVNGAPADAARKYSTNNYAFFVQDDWKVRPNLTVNLGLRYEYFPPISDSSGQQSNFVLGPNGLVDSRVTVVDRLFKPDKNNFGPQFGFAYSPGFLNDKAVLRGGFGIGYNRIPNVVFINSRGNPPFFSRFSICCGTSGTPGIDDFGNPFRDGLILYALGTSRSPGSFPANPRLGGGINPVTGAPVSGGAVEIYGSTEEQPNARSLRYSLEAQYQLPSKLTATLGYQGSSNRNLIRLVNQNFIFEQANPAFSAVFLPTPDVKSNYNALLATLERRFANGFQVQANYRFSKSLDNLSNEGPGFVTNQTYPVDNETEYGPSDFDVTHNLNVFGLWDLPIFRKRNDWVGTLFGGFQISGIVTWHTGFPWTPVVTGPGVRSASGAEFGPFRPTVYSGGNGTDTSNDTFLNGNGNFTGSFIPGANCINTPGGCNRIFLTTLNRNAMNQATFLLNPPGIGRNTFRGPRYFSTDLSVSKRFNLPSGFRLNETTGLDLRVNFFNIFNNLNLNNFGFSSDSTRINNGDNPNPNFGRATSGLAGRVVELQARFSF
ncbi:MAG: TonB-dependent receptor [Acidobacteriota bacterium]|nr:TonB-dependent receptor [Acidobacteriota bacterium]